MNKINKLHFKSLGRIFLMVGIVFAVSGITTANAQILSVKCKSSSTSVFTKEDCLNSCSKVFDAYFHSDSFQKCGHGAYISVNTCKVKNGIGGEYSYSFEGGAQCQSGETPKGVSIALCQSKLVYSSAYTKCKSSCNVIPAELLGGASNCSEYVVDMGEFKNELSKEIATKLIEFLPRAAAKMYDPNYIYK